MIGFGSEHEAQHDKKADYSAVISQVTPEDIIQFGMIPEMVGRLPIITTLTALDEDALMQILTEPKNALVRQYQKLFEMEDAELKFTDEALRLLAHKAMARDTGARALRAIMEELMVDLMYDLPEKAKPGKYSITPDVVERKTDLFKQAQSRQVKKESA
jgi:ATP-dependent Clp protease ATP-binding subunit ClpX